MTGPLPKRVAHWFRLVSNVHMGLSPPGSWRVGLKVAAVALALCACVGAAWMLWLRGPGHRITDQELLREAVEEWKRAGEPGTGPGYQIFEQ